LDPATPGFETFFRENLAMARPKIRRRKRAATVPGIPVYKPLQRPVQLQEDLLATVVADGVHREGSEAGFGTRGRGMGLPCRQRSPTEADPSSDGV